MRDDDVSPKRSPLHHVLRDASGETGRRVARVFRPIPPRAMRIAALARGAHTPFSVRSGRSRSKKKAQVPRGHIFRHAKRACTRERAREPKRSCSRHYPGFCRYGTDEACGVAASEFDGLGPRRGRREPVPVLAEL